MFAAGRGRGAQIEAHVTDIAVLRAELLRLCDSWIEMVDSFSSDEDLVAAISYPDRSGNQLTAPRISALNQVFNHGVPPHLPRRLRTWAELAALWR